MNAMKAYRWWRRHGNLIDFLHGVSSTFDKGECWHRWDFMDHSSFKIMHGIPYVLDGLLGATEWTRLEP